MKGGDVEEALAGLEDKDCFKKVVLNGTSPDFCRHLQRKRKEYVVRTNGQAVVAEVGELIAKGVTDPAAIIAKAVEVAEPAYFSARV